MFLIADIGLDSKISTCLYAATWMIKSHLIFESCLSNIDNKKLIQYYDQPKLFVSDYSPNNIKINYDLRDELSEKIGKKFESKFEEFLKKMVKNKEIVCFTTDKSGRWSCDTPDNYRSACKAQLNDQSKIEKITAKDHDVAEKKMNCEALALLRMLGLSDDEKNNRLRRAVVANGVKIPPFYGTRKDHKVVPEREKDVGPKVRPVCGAEDCTTKRASYILCQIGSELIGGNPTHCDSTTDLLEEIEKVNQTGKVSKNVIIGSLDVEALYPSLDIEKCSEVIRKRLEESALKLKD